MPRNAGAPWNFFMSHVQKEAGRAVALITSDLEKAGTKVWLDVNMADCSAVAMMEGVEASHNFVLVLTDGYFKSSYCVDELRKALSLGKNIILTHGEGVNVGAALKAKPVEFETIGDETSIQLVVSDPEFRQTSIKKLLSKATNVPSLASVTIGESGGDAWITTKYVQGVKAGTDAGSGAKNDLHYYGHVESGWFMLGHAAGPGSSNHKGGGMIVVKGDKVKKCTGWLRVWKDENSGNEKDYDIYVPTHFDPSYVALGVVCHFRISNHAEPPSDLPVALVHKSLCEPCALGDELWTDAGTKAKWDVTLQEVPHTGTMWPSKATLIGSPLTAHTLQAKYIA